MARAPKELTRWSALLLASFVPAIAAGQSPKPPVTFTLDYVAKGDCPGSESFQEAIRTRTEHAQLAPRAEAQVRFSVTLEPAGSANKSVLRVQLRNGSTTVREVPDGACVDAMQSMAIIAAMVLEAQAAQTQANASGSEAGPGAQTNPPDEPTNSVPASTVRVTPPPVTVAPTAGRPKTRRLEFLLALDGTSESALAPTPAPGVALGVELRRPSSSWLSFSGRLSGVLAQSSLVKTDSGDARFQLVTARLDLCGIQGRFAKLSVRACAQLDGGALRGRGLDALNQRDQYMPWLGLGLGARLELALVDRLGLELLGGGRGLIVHDRFAFSPGTIIHEVPVIAWNFGGGLSLHL